MYIRNTEVLAGTYVHNYEHTFSGYRYKPHLFVQMLDISFSLRLLSPNAYRLCLLLAATERTIQSRNPLSRRTRSLLPTLLNMAIRPALARKKLKSKERFKTYSARNTSDRTGQALWRYTGADTLRARPVLQQPVPATMPTVAIIAETVNDYEERVDQHEAKVHTVRSCLRARAETCLGSTAPA